MKFMNNFKPQTFKHRKIHSGNRKKKKNNKAKILLILLKLSL
jgi:hypothetical protein